MPLTINQFALVHHTMLDHHMYSVSYEEMNQFSHVQNVKVTPIVQTTKLVSMNDAKIHVHKAEFVLKMQFAMFKHIDLCAHVQRDSLEMLNLLVMKVSTTGNKT